MFLHFDEKKDAGSDRVLDVDFHALKKSAVPITG